MQDDVRLCRFKGAAQLGGRPHIGSGAIDSIF
jgi:hypothetical protein